MSESQPLWSVKDKGRLLAVAMEGLAGSAHISFEGNLSALPLSTIPGASSAETAVLKRNTRWPEQDFIVLPLEPHLVRQIIAAFGGTLSRKVLHVQIEKEGRLELGLFDNPQSVTFFGSNLPPSMFERLQAENAISPRTSAS